MNAAMNYNALISAGAGLLGVVVGGVLTAYSQWRDRLNERYRDQLQNFYSPILGLREEIKVKSRFRVRLQEITEEKWQQNVRTATEKDCADYARVIEYGNEQLKKELIPTYEEIAKLFKERMYLAEPSTRDHYSKLIDFMEIWRLFLANSLSYAVANEIVHSEKDLYPFYEDVEKNFVRLQKKLSGRGAF
jgi:hypothetical protein